MAVLCFNFVAELKNKKMDPNELTIQEVENFARLRKSDIDWQIKHLEYIKTELTKADDPSRTVTKDMLDAQIEETWERTKYDTGAWKKYGRLAELKKESLWAEIEGIQTRLRHGMSLEEWSEYQRLIEKKLQSAYDPYREPSVRFEYEQSQLAEVRRLEFWVEFLMRDRGYGCRSILEILRFELLNCLGYWQHNVQYADTNVYRQMRWSVDLLRIIVSNGNESGFSRSMPTRVNLRNKERFLQNTKIAGNEVFDLGEMQQVRFLKAYHLLFELLRDNMLAWPELI